MTSTGFYTLDDGALELLQTLYESVDAAEECTDASPAPVAYLGNSCREKNRVETRADSVEHKGIRLHTWVIGSNKTHITPIDTIDECVYIHIILHIAGTVLKVLLYLCRIGKAAKLTPPEMVFGKNQLVLYHELSGVCYSFLAVEALKGAHFPPPISDQAQDIVANKQLKVAIAKHNTNKFVELLSLIDPENGVI